MCQRNRQQPPVPEFDAQPLLDRLQVLVIMWIDWQI